VTRQVRVLRLSGLDAGEAQRATRDLLTNRELGDLSSVLVLDDTGTLSEHVSAFEALLRSGQVPHVLCVAIGPVADDQEQGGNQQIVVPGVIGHSQGSAVLWVSDPIGVDWPLSAAAVAVLRPARGRTGLDHLIEALSAVEVFERVRELVVDLPDGVASPGLRLAAAGDEAASFAAALAAAIRRLTAAPPGSRRLEPLIAPSDLPAPEVRLRENGDLARQHDECAETAAAAEAAVAELPGLRELPGARQLVAGTRGLVTDTGVALRTFRDHVGELLDYADSPSGPDDRKLERLSDAGLVLIGDAGRTDFDARPDARGPGQIREAVRRRMLADDSLPQVIAQLTAIERLLTPQGSRSYRPEVDRLCPQQLVQRLTDPPPVPAPQVWLPVAWFASTLLGSLAGLAGVVTGLITAAVCTGAVACTTGLAAGHSRRHLAASLLASLAGVAAGVAIGLAAKPPLALAAAGFVLALVLAGAVARWSWQSRLGAWRRRLSLDEAATGADALAALTLRVAAGEWSADKSLLDAVGRERICVQAVHDQLREYADGVDKKHGGSARASRLSGALSPTLRQLVLAVLAAHPRRDHSDGQAGYRQAKAATRDLLDSWETTATERGPLAWPPFAATSDQGFADAADDELAAITAVASYDPHDVMWQLCAPTELTMLDTATRPAVVTFAPQVAQSQLARALPANTMWTTSGMRAGLLRLVPLKRDIVQLVWASEAAGAPPHDRTRSSGEWRS